MKQLKRQTGKYKIITSETIGECNEEKCGDPEAVQGHVFLSLH